jgi:succinoglycan biosynthesis transport protein ExoP
MRRPSLHTYLGVGSEIGLLAYLRGETAENQAAIQPVQDPLSALTVITGGGRSNEPTDQLLGSQTFASLLKAARERFEFVVIDSPPVLPVVDARYLAQYADVTIQVVRHATTSQTEARNAATQFQENMRPGAKYLGILSHEARVRRQGYYYKGRYMDYYGSEA